MMEKDNRTIQKAIVTGATGFIGKYLVRELLAHDIEVFAVVRPNSKNTENLPTTVHKVECSLADISHLPELIAEKDIDAIFHLAWQGVSDNEDKNYHVQLDNIRCTLELIEAAHTMQIKRFLFAGSIHEYEVQIEMKKRERSENLVNMYKTAKLAAHWMGKVLAGSLGMKFLCPIIINAYGEGEKSTRLINTFVRKMINGESMALTNGRQLYDFVYVSDVVKAIYLVAEKGIDGKDYIIGSGTPKPLKEYLSEAAEIVRPGSSIDLFFGKLPSKAIHLPMETFDMTDLMQDTGYVPDIEFGVGIERMIQTIRFESG